MTLSLPPDSALLLVDLQHGITALPTTPPAHGVVANGARLADAFRAARLPVVLVSVDPLAAGTPPIDEEPPAMTLDERFAQLRPELGEPDLAIVKPGWDAFLGTGLDVQLRRRGIGTLVVGGIRTRIGVESTVRTAFGLGYGVLLVDDALADLDAAMTEEAWRTVFPRLGRRTSTDGVLAALAAAQ